MESKAFFDVNEGGDKRWLVISKIFQDPSQSVDLLSTASPWTESSLDVPQNVIYLISDPVQKYFVVYFSCYWQQRKLKAAIDNREFKTSLSPIHSVHIFE